MKFIRWFIWIISILIISGCSNTVEDTKKYLLENYNNLQIESQDQHQLDILNDDLHRNDIILIGEVHGIKVNSELQMLFLKYFKEKIDIRYILAENSYSNTFFINKYLETGDDDYLSIVYHSCIGTYAWTKESYNFWKNMYEYNKGFNEDEKIKVVGVDIEHNPVTSYYYNIEVLPDTDPPKEIEKMIEGVQDIFNYKPVINTEFFRLLEKSIEENEQLYMEYLKEDFIGFTLVNKNVINKYEAYRKKGCKVEWNSTRDKMMYDNFLVLNNVLPKGKYFGQWGLNHVFQMEESEVNWFASMLNSDSSQFKNKILSIVLSYDNCERMEIGVSKPNQKISFVYFPVFKEVNDQVGGDINIYKLNGKNSPFRKEKMIDFYTGAKRDEHINEYFQYLVMIRDSKATTPFGN